MKDKVLTLLVEHNFPKLRALLSEMNPADLSVLLTEIPASTLTVVFRLLPKDLACETFVEMDADSQQHLITAFSDPELKEVLDKLFVDDTVDIIEEMPANVVRKILKNSSPEKRVIINEILNYPENSAGSLMTVEYVSLHKEMTVSEAFEKIRRDGVNKETIYTCYVTDGKRILLGIVTAKNLMLARPEDLISDLMETNIISCKTSDNGEEVAHIIEKYGLIALPVVDNENRLVGIITFDDAMDVIKEETDDEFMKMAAIQPLDQNYFKTSVFSHSKKRIVWLMVLMLSATFTGLIITGFENALTALLVSFIPMLMDTGGNSGSQSSAIIIRGLATGEIKLSDFGRVVYKEFRIALIVGVILAVVNAARLWLLNVVVYHNPDGLVREMLVVGITLIATVVTAKVFGCCLPMLAKKLKLDPALIASPIVTTLVDTTTVLIYFVVAINVFGF